MYIRNIGTESVQEIFFVNEKPLEVAEITLNSYVKVNPTSLFGYDVQHTKN